MPLLLAVHLNDNGINYDPETYGSIMEIFGSDLVYENENENKNKQFDPRSHKVNKYVKNSREIKHFVQK